jgi:hypothetical protein
MRKEIERTNEILRNTEGAWVKDMNDINRCRQREWPGREGP